jgi:hypothetical protein
VGSKLFYSRTSLPVIEAWKFIVAAAVLCVIGAIIDVL